MKEKDDSAHNEPTPKNRLVVASKGWGELIPEWLLQEVGKERFMLGIQHLREPRETVGDAEVCAYLFTAACKGQLSLSWVVIYKFVLGQLLQELGLPQLEIADVQLKAGLTAEEARMLKKLRRDLYRARGGEIDDPILNALRGITVE